MYSVTVDSVNTMRYGGKIKTRNTKSGLLTGKTSATKKAVVTLAEGYKIDFYSNIKKPIRQSERSNLLHQVSDIKSQALLILSQVLRRRNPCFDRIRIQEEGMLTANGL